MARKSKSKTKHSARKHRRSARNFRKEPQNAIIKKGETYITEDELLGFIVANGGQADLLEILGAFELGRSHRKAMHVSLQELCRRKVLYDEGESYLLKKEVDFLEGTLTMNPRGFGFVVPVGSSGDRVGDVFVGGRKMGSALHGDRVIIKVLTRKSGRSEGVVLRVLERGSSLIVGIYTAGKVGYVTPEDERFPFNVLIKKEKSCGAANGDAVVAKITEFSNSGLSNPKGKIVEVLGDPDSIHVQTEMVIRKFELSHTWQELVERQLEKIDPQVKLGEPGRKDLRDVNHITIDGETARDFDDAVAVLKIDKGTRLYVSIADVSHYVTAGSPLDDEAYARGTSVYFPTVVLPMLPEKLSNDLCSLVPHQDRYAFTAILDFDKQGQLIKKKFTKSVINSKHRMTYDKVKEILIDKEPKIREQYNDLIADLEIMESLGHNLLDQRMARGSIGFELPEAFVEVGENDEVTGIARRHRNFAHQIIEEFMLAANEAVAKTLDEQDLQKGLFRIHETPDPLKVGEFAKFAATMGIKLPQDEQPGTPHWFGLVLEEGRGTPQEYIVNNLLLRTMKQAKYSPENVGHFGLAAKYYAHFTSPIRRYPDLMVHRALAESLTPSKKKKKGEPDHSVHEAGEFLSKRERVAVDAEREMIERLKVRYMEDKVGETFEAVISGVSSFGLFVELTESFISGGVAIGDLRDDYYSIDEKNHRLMGRKSNRILQIGDLVTVRLQSVEKSRRRLNFVVEN